MLLTLSGPVSQHSGGAIDPGNTINRPHLFRKPESLAWKQDLTIFKANDTNIRDQYCKNALLWRIAKHALLRLYQLHGVGVLDRWVC